MKLINKIENINVIIFIFISLFIVIVPFLVWSFYTSIDQVSHVRGTVIALGKTQEIQTSIDGVIEKISVEEGDYVKRGDLLLKIEDLQYQASYDAVSSKVAAVEATLARLRAEVYSKELEFPSILKSYPDFIESQTQLYMRRKQALNDELQILSKSLKLAEQELKNIKPLVKLGYVGETEVLRLERQVVEKEGEIINKKNKFFQDAQSEMAKAEEELSTREQELEEKKVNLERTNVYATMDALVKNIIVTTKGAKVRPGDVILQLLPDTDNLIIETKLEPSQISFVKVGQKAAIKLDAYDYSIYGIFKGNVKYISPDTLVEKTNEGEKYFFRVLVEVNKKTLLTKDNKSINLTPGMTAQVDIITGNRTVFTYLTKPIIKTLDQSFKER